MSRRLLFHYARFCCMRSRGTDNLKYDTYPKEAVQEKLLPLTEKCRTSKFTLGAHFCGQMKN